MSEDEHLDLSASDSAEKFKTAVGLLIQAVPYLGSPLGSMMLGSLTSRKLDRVADFLNCLRDDLETLKDDLSEDYLKSDEFEEILDETLQRVAKERTEAKRVAFRNFLTGEMKNRMASYDDQIRVLRVIENLQEQHILVLRAIDQEPNPDPHAISGSIEGTLVSRVGGLSGDQITELVSQLNDMRIVRIASTRTMMTAHGAEDLRGRLTDLGRKLIQYISS